MFNLPQPLKLYSFGPNFRHGKPQAGRYRQFYQFNLEIIGEGSPALDAELIMILKIFLESLGFNFETINLHLNSIGCHKCRPLYKKALIRYYRQNSKKICSQCKKRLKVNPLRVLDCKDKKCFIVKENVPSFLDYLCPECQDHFKAILEILDHLNIPYILDKTLVRGMDYYTRTVFEILKSDQEKQLSLGGGGRYDYLVKILGGPDKPAVGFAFGAERLIEELKKTKKKLGYPQPEVFLIQIGDAARKQSFVLLEKLRKENILTFANLDKDSLRVQLENADRWGVRYALILGQQEILDGMIILKDMNSGLQETVLLDKIINELKKRLK